MDQACEYVFLPNLMPLILNLITILRHRTRFLNYVIPGALPLPYIILHSHWNGFRKTVWIILIENPDFLQLNKADK